MHTRLTTLFLVAALLAPTTAYAEDLGTLTSVDVGGAHIVPGDTVTIDELSSLSQQWSMNFAWPEPVPNSRAFLVVFRGTFGALDGGVLQNNVNYAPQLQAWAAGSNSISKSYSIPPLGTIGLASGEYTVAVIEFPFSGYVPQNALDWFASGGAAGKEPFRWSFLTFNYDATPNPTELPGALTSVEVATHPVTGVGRTITEGEQVYRDELNPLNGTTDSQWDFSFAWPNAVANQRALLMVFRGVYGNIEGGAPVAGLNYSSTLQAWAAGNNTLGKSIGLPPLNHPSTTPGTYTVVVAERDPKYLATPTQNAEALWFSSGGTQGVAPVRYSTLTFDFLGDQPQCCSSVLFLPGIESSRLYRPDYAGGTDRLWEPSGNDDLRDLYLDETGQGIRDDVYVKRGDVLDELPTGLNIYKSFLESLDGLQDTNVIAGWEATPYDWRLSLDDILTKGNEIDGRVYFTGDLAPTSTPFIIQELRHLANDSLTGKVTIVAHSNGGLLAKRLTEVLGETESAELIDRIIFVASPQAGTPMALAAGLHGYNQQKLWGLIVSAQVARAFASTSPMFYHLLPSEAYFTSVADPAVTFDPALTEWVGRYGDAIHSGSSLSNFLAGTYARVDAEHGDLDSPIQFSSGMLSDAATLHSSLDSWQPPQGVEVVQIAGWGRPDTVSGINYVLDKDGSIKPKMSFTIDGDGTVVVPSALWTGESQKVSNYFIDLKNYNRNHPLSTFAGTFPFEHSSITEVDAVTDFISDIVKESVLPLNNYQYITISPPFSSDARLQYSLHSPLALDLYDDQGRHTGVSTTTGQIEEQIPGTYFVEFGETKYAFTDIDAPVTLFLDGYDTGTFTLGIEELAGDNVTSTVTFKDIPTTENTEATISVTSGLITLSPLTLDINGDGVAEANLEPQLNGIVEFEKLPLTVTATNKTMILGSQLPILDATITGFPNGVTLANSDITGTPSCTTAATATGSAGAYPIMCAVGTLQSEYYKFEDFVVGTLTIQYKWGGFTQPIDDSTVQPGITPSVFKAGSTVPVKFVLKNSTGSPTQAVALPQWLTPTKLGALSAPVDEVVDSSIASSGSAFKYDSTAKQYVYNWSTKGFAPGSWYRISAQLDDGTIRSVVVGLR